MGVETVLIGAAIGAGIGAIGGAVSGGGDRIWQGALTGAVGGAITGGVGSWASGASGLGLGNVAGYALGGALGGMGAGALGTALGGGNSSDYLRNIATGGVLGGATGALGGYLAPGGEQVVTPESMGIDASNVNYQEALTGQLPSSEAASGVQTGTTAAPAVQQSITGPTAQPTQGLNINPEAGVVTDNGLQTIYKNPNVGLSINPSTGTVANEGVVTQYNTNPTLSNTATTPTLSEGLNINPNTNTVIDGGKTTTYNAAGQTFPKESVDSTAFKDWEAGINKTVGDLYKTQTGTGKMGLEDYLKMQGKAQLFGGGIKALGAIATAPETQQNRNQLMDLYNQQNAANQFYQNQLQQTYTNPMGYLGSGEAAATRSAALRQALAQNAAAGRRTQGGALANQLMQTQLQNLQNYRRGIPAPNYGTAAQNLQLAQQYSPTADIFGGLASMATPLSLYSLFPG